MSVIKNIPDGAMITAEEYLTEREMSNIPAIMVEGDDDNIFFQIIQDELLKAVNPEYTNIIQAINDLQIDIPDIIKSPSGEKLGNGDKVELVCRMADQNNYKGLFIGFVDRDFREFEISKGISDKIKSHYKSGKLMWSRGHSVENYLFNLQTLLLGLFDYAVSPRLPIKKALSVFENNFQRIMRFASAISLAARDLELINLISRSFDESIISIINNEIQLDLAVWDLLLLKNQKLDDIRRRDFISLFDKYFLLTENSESETIKWICHGHIGMKFIWICFEKIAILVHSNKNANIAKKDIRLVNESDRFIKFSRIWINNILINEWNSDDSIAICFKDLGINTFPHTTE
jgi:hypothetical protein